MTELKLIEIDMKLIDDVFSKEEPKYEELAKVDMEIAKYLEANRVWGDVYTDTSGWIRKVVIDIDRGDWKHEHLRCKWLMEEIGFEEDDEVVTESDGSDTYSATHYFIKKL